MEMDGKVALVTGGTKGIGKAIVNTLIRKGVKVCITYDKDDKSANELNKQLSEISNDFLIIKSDISNYDDVENVFKEIIKNFGKIDILINNAGIFPNKEIYSNTSERYKKTFDINFFGCVFATEIFAKNFKGKLGKIINISSIAGINPFSYTGGIRAPEYDCSKASLDLYTKIMAKTFDGKILVNGIAPGSTTTPQWEGTDTNFMDIRAKESLIKRFIKPEEISNTVLFLLESDAINGHIIVVDGGNILN